MVAWGSHRNCRYAAWALILPKGRGDLSNGMVGLATTDAHSSLDRLTRCAQAFQGNLALESDSACVIDCQNLLDPVDNGPEAIKKGA